MPSGRARGLSRACRWVLVLLSAWMLAGCGSGAPKAVVLIGGMPQVGLRSAALDSQGFAACHDHPQGNVPPRAVIAARPHSRIVDALSQGVMRPHAAGLSAQQIDDLARYLKQ